MSSSKSKPLFVDPFLEDERFAFVFAEFEKMRKKIKAPLTEYAAELIVRDTRRLSAGNLAVAIAILEQSIELSWRGVFALRTTAAANNSATTAAATNTKERKEL